MAGLLRFGEDLFFNCDAIGGRIGDRIAAATCSMWTQE
jgi:hypothetical protein